MGGTALGVPVAVAPRPRALQLPSLGEEDQDVARERARVGSTAPHGHLLLLKDLTKVRVVGLDPALSLAVGLQPLP